MKSSPGGNVTLIVGMRSPSHQGTVWYWSRGGVLSLTVQVRSLFEDTDSDNKCCVAQLIMSAGLRFIRYPVLIKNNGKEQALG